MNYHHSGDLGDILYAVPCVLSMQLRHAGGRPANLYLDAGRINPEPVIPLLAAQPAFGEVKVWDGEKIDVDLDLFRLTRIDFTKGHLPRRYFYAFHANYDLSQPWLTVEPDERYRNRVVVNRTARYRNPRIDYKFLNDYDPVFLGLPHEFADFQKEVPDAEHVPTADLLGAARIVAAGKVFVGNQSGLFAVAEAVKCVRVLECSLFCPNVIPHGPHGWDAVSQIGFEAIVKELAA